MNCEEIQPLIGGYFDGEMDLVRSLEIERHLESCADCAKLLGNLQGLRTALQAAQLHERVPERLRRMALPRGSPAPAGEKESWNSSWRGFRSWIPMGALALGMAAIFMGAPIVKDALENRQIAQEIVSAHVRSLMGAHLTDVASTDRHTVKPWFSGKLDYAPFVLDLSEYSFPLIGGRLDYILQRPVAALVYQHHQHFINLLMWPSGREKDRTPALLSRRGYNIVHWTKGGMAYWVVSDLNSQDLQKFALIIQSQTLLPGSS